MYFSSWRSPSNIALIKYWGKHGIQLPRNPSLSFTLSACHTDMNLKVEIDAPSPSITVLYGGNETPAFEPKIRKLFALLYDQLPWLKNSAIVIDSINTFPHAAGIASSASSMSALALCLLDIDDQISGTDSIKNDTWWYRASEISRLGSGSASRSVFPIAALWGRNNSVGGSSDQYAIPWAEQLAPIYHTYHDAILITSSNEKKVSSTAGHALMNNIQYADTRYQQANTNLLQLVDIMRSEYKVNDFITIVESEALQLHALMMMSSPPYILIEPDTLFIIREIWKFRKESNIPVCFTLDAGPNVHLLYPATYKSEVQDFIQTALLKYCQDGIFILDEVGTGPIKLPLG